MWFWPRSNNVPPMVFSDDARAVLERAAHEVRVRGEDAVTPEHILAALIDDRSSTSITLVLLKDADFSEMRTRVLPKHSESALKPEQVAPLYTARAHKVLVAAAYEGFNARSVELGPLELLAGILRDDKTSASRTLRGSGVMLAQVRAAIATLPRLSVG